MFSGKTGLNRELAVLCIVLAAAAIAVLFDHLDTSAVQAATSSYPAKSLGPPQNPTYAVVAPILQRKCVGCHSPQGGAPFSLLNYQDAKQWGEQMLEVTQNRYMPPWLPAPECAALRGERRLDPAELAAIRGWVGAGMPEGPAIHQSSVDTATHALPAAMPGSPDLTLQLSAPVMLPGSGPDQFVNLLVPNTASSRHAIRALEIRANDPQAVRSIWVQVDARNSFRHAYPADWQSGIPGMEPPASIQAQLTSPGGLLFWTPNAPVLASPAQQAWTLDPGSDLVLSAHLKTTGRSEQIQLTIRLYFGSNVPEKRRPEILELQRDASIAIAPGATDARIGGQFVLPVSASLSSIFPRAHFLGKEINAFALLPNGHKECLVSIPKWDVDWQAVYGYTKPITLPKGSVIHWEYRYDNSANNPHNPNDPPEQVHAGTTAKDEVNQLWLELLAPVNVGNHAGWREQIRKAIELQPDSVAQQGLPAEKQNAGASSR